MNRKSIIKRGLAYLISLGVIMCSFVGVFAGSKNSVQISAPISSLQNITSGPIPDVTFIPEVKYPVTGTNSMAQTQFNDLAHKEIVRQGINIVKKNYPSLAARLDKIIQYKVTVNGRTTVYNTTATQLLIDNSVMPDINENDIRTAYGINYSSYAGHFYDPATGLNYMGESNPNAYIRFNNHYWSAKYAANSKDAFSELGLSLHYFGDLNAPHHAANVPAYFPKVTPNGSTTHQKYETWVDSNLSKDTSQNSANGDYFVVSSTFVSIANYYATQAKGQISNAMSSSASNNLTAMLNTLPYAKRGAAGMIYRFLKETSW